MDIQAGTKVRHRKTKRTGVVMAVKQVKIHVQWMNGMASWCTANQLRVMKVNGS